MGFMKGVLFAIASFLIGLAVAPHLPVDAEVRLADTAADHQSIQRIPFEAFRVYPNEVHIAYPDIRYAKVASNSMAPIITDKSTVFEVTPRFPSDIKAGDVISFHEPSVNGTVLHLVVDSYAENGEVFYQTKGVANSEPDPWLVPFSNVKGIMVGVFR